MAHEGRLFTYAHHNGKIAAVVELTCQTDFAANTPEFKLFGEQLAMHVAATRPIYPHLLLKEEFNFSDGTGETVEAVVTKMCDLLGETITVRRISSYEFGAMT